MKNTLNRRHLLCSTMAGIALPALESFGFKKFASAAENLTPPKRLMFTTFGWGATEESWFPKLDQVGKDYTLPQALEPLERHKADFSVVQGLSHKHFSDGHWGSTMWLTGANRFAQPGITFHNSISADQVAAEQFGIHTRFNSLQFNGSEQNLNGAGHGPGLSLAWDRSGKPIGGQNGPMEAYRRLFVKNDVSKEQLMVMLTEKRSILDAILSNANFLKTNLSKTDNDKLEEYFAGIRDIENRLNKEENWIDRPHTKPTLPEPKEFKEGKEEIKLMHDLMIAALQTDSTRVLTFRQSVSTFLTSLDITVHMHDMSHYHGTRAEKLDASQKRDFESCHLLARLIDKLKNTKEADGSSLFDHTTLAYGSNLRTGHTLQEVPIIITGKGSNLRLGENIVVPKNEPLNNLWLTLLKGSGVTVDQHGDSTGILKEVMA